jgi:16S rRNA C1402 N4-methylase RsmH
VLTKKFQAVTVQVEKSRTLATFKLEGEVTSFSKGCFLSVVSYISSQGDIGNNREKIIKWF